MDPKAIELMDLKVKYLIYHIEGLEPQHFVLLLYVIFSVVGRACPCLDDSKEHLLYVSTKQNMGLADDKRVQHPSRLEEPCSALHPGVRLVLDALMRSTAPTGAGCRRCKFPYMSGMFHHQEPIVPCRHDEPEDPFPCDEYYIPFLAMAVNCLPDLSKNCLDELDAPRVDWEHMDSSQAQLFVNWLIAGPKCMGPYATNLHLVTLAWYFVYSDPPHTMYDVVHLLPYIGLPQSSCPFPVTFKPSELEVAAYQRITLLNYYTGSGIEHKFDRPPNFDDSIYDRPIPIEEISDPSTYQIPSATQSLHLGYESPELDNWTQSPVSAHTHPSQESDEAMFTPQESPQSLPTIPETEGSTVSIQYNFHFHGLDETTVTHMLADMNPPPNFHTSPYQNGDSQPHNS
jgi:hypothetical protein